MMKNIPLLVLCTCVIFSGFSEEFFKSNSIGMALEKIDVNTVYAYEYYVSLSEKPNGDTGKILTKKLFRNGEILTTWEKTFHNGAVKNEQIEKGETREVYDFTDGKLMAFSTFGTDGLLEKWEYSYGDGGTVISKKKVFPVEAADEIRYSTLSNGRLRSNFIKTDSDAELVVQGVSDKRYLQWIGSADKSIFEHYSEGKLSINRIESEGSVIEWFYTYYDTYYERTNIARNENSDVDKSKLKTSGPIIVEKYNLHDKLKQKTVHTGGKRVFFENAVFDDNGTRLLSRTVIENNIRLDTEYFYDGDRLTDEYAYENKKLMKQITYNDNGRVELVYEDQILKFRLFFDDNGFLTASEVVEGEDSP